MSNAPSAATVCQQFPVSPSQMRFWFMDQLDPTGRALNIAVRWEIRGEVRSNSLQQALNQIVARHEILRTRIVEDDGGLPVQEVLPELEPKLGLVDIRAVPEADHADRIDAIAQEMANRPYDLSAPPLFRVTLVRFAPERAALLISAHHAVFDGYSIAVLGRELGQLTAEAETGAPADLPELPLQYGDYALWQTDCAEQGAWDESLNYWRERLADVTYLQVPGDGLGNPDDVSPARLTVAMPSDFDSRLTTAATRHGCSTFAFGAACLATTLHQLTGSQDIAFACPESGRPESDLEPLIGAFVNTLVLRMPVAPEGTLAQQIDTAQTTVTEALMHQELPYDRLLRAVRAKGKGEGRTPLTSVLFSLQRVFLEERRYGPIELASVPSYTPGIIYDLQINLLGRNTGWHLMVDYNAARYSEARVTELTDLLQQTLETALDAPDTPLTALVTPTLAEAEAESTPQGETPPSIQGKHPSTDLEALEAKLAVIWAKILSLPADQCRGDFFDLGGYSILSLRLISQVEKELGKRVPLGTFLADPTISGMARAMAGEPAQSSILASETDATDTASAPQAPVTLPQSQTWEVIPLRAGAPDGPVIVTISQLFLYHRTARAFREGTEVINLAVPDRVAMERQRQAGLASICAEAANLLLDTYPNRQITLLGHCVDGVIAIEIARHMSEAGTPPSTVGVIDGWAPGTWPSNDRGRVGQWVAYFADRLRRWGHYLHQRLRGEIGWQDLLRRTSLGTRFLRWRGVVPAQSDEERLLNDINQMHQSLRGRAMREDAARARLPYNGDVQLFATESQSTEGTRRLFGWRGVLAPDTAIVPLKGWHEDALLAGGFEGLAQALDARMSRAMAHRQDAEERQQ